MLLRFRLPFRLAHIWIILLIGWAFTAQAVCAQTVGYWRFEEGSPNTTATGKIRDYSGNGLNGTAFDGPVYVPVPVTGSSLGLKFDGGTQRILIPDSSSLHLTKSLTLEAFIRYDGGGSEACIIFRGDDRPYFDPYHLSVKNGCLWFCIDDGTAEGRGNAAELFSPSELPVGQFIHVAGTLDNATGAMRLYINGKEIASQITKVRPYAILTGENSGLGIDNVQNISDGFSAGFNGIIDEVRISNVALPPSQFLNGGQAKIEPQAPQPKPKRVFFYIAYLNYEAKGKDKSKYQSFPDAAATWEREIKSEYSFQADKDIFIEAAVRSKLDFQIKWDEISNNLSKQGDYAVVRGALFTHATSENVLKGRHSWESGLEFATDLNNPNYDDNTLTQGSILSLAKLNWVSNGKLELFSCNSGRMRPAKNGWSPAQAFATRQRVMTTGEQGYSDFSEFPDRYVKITNNSKNVYLRAYKRSWNVLEFQYKPDNSAIPAAIYHPR